MTKPSVVWFRRDLRVRDQPTFLAAAGAATLALFVLDDRLLGPSGPARRTFLYRGLRALDAALGGRLLVVRGDPVEAVAQVAAEVGAATVHVAADFGPYGARRDAAVAEALAAAGRELLATGSSYAVAPGRVRKADGSPFRVFTPFRRAWQDHGWRRPADTHAGTLAWLDPAGLPGVPVPADEPVDAELPVPQTPSVPSWPGGSSTPTCCTTARTLPAPTTTPPSTRCRAPAGPTRGACSTPGAPAAPATRSSTPGCGSCASRRGCTTGCG